MAGDLRTSGMLAAGACRIMDLLLLRDEFYLASVKGVDRWTKQRAVNAGVARNRALRDEIVPLYEPTWAEAAAAIESYVATR